jgi:precorrin-3B C17-methyltransferase
MEVNTMIYVIGIGPGSINHMTYEARTCIQKCDVIVGYKTYTELIRELTIDKMVVENGMRREVERCQKAIDLAMTGKTVGVISSGDAGVYGMAGLILEMITTLDCPRDSRLRVEIIPGVTASSAAAAIVGAPLMHDYCHISLSDLLTPIDLIEKRIRMATRGEFVMCFYNPRSIGRKDHLSQAFKWISEETGIDLVVAHIKDAYRESQNHAFYTLKTMNFEEVTMTSIVLVGNPQTKIYDEFMITPRGYHV